MKSVTAAIMISFISALVSGQNLIGYRYDQIRSFMKENRKDMNFNKVNNSQFSYLKYTDGQESQTILFFLDADSVCRSVRIVCDESSKARMIKEFNSTFKKNGENKWIDKRNGTNYIIELSEEDWASVITMLPEKINLSGSNRTTEESTKD